MFGTEVRDGGTIEVWLDNVKAKMGCWSIFNTIGSKMNPMMLSNKDTILKKYYQQ